MVTTDDVASTSRFYPGSTVIEDHVSIFLLGFRHAVSLANFPAWEGRVRDLGWHVHPYLLNDPEQSWVCCEDRKFAPQPVLTPAASKTMLGHTFGEGAERDRDTEARILRHRLSPRHGKANHVENLLLSRDPARCAWLGKRIYARLAADRVVGFFIDWVDLWLFDDESGLIAFKARVDASAAPAGDPGLLTLSQLSELHRYLRDCQDVSVTVSTSSQYKSEQQFWKDVVFGAWLGRYEPGRDLLMRDGRPSSEVFDGFSRYCKLLTGVQVGEMGTGEEEFAWSSPLADPMSDYPYVRHFAELQRGEWTNAILAFQAASIAGYPSYRDLFLVELATTSREGDAAGHDRKRGWQYSIEYIRKLLDEGGIEIWEYWSGLALRDVCAFVAWSESMPLIRGNQLEARYYPLYAHAYHLRFELDSIAQNCVDHDLIDNQLLRTQLRRFETFRSRYWFKEVTRDFVGVEVFERMKKGMQVDALFETVSTEVNEVGDYLGAMAERGRQALIALAIAAAYPVYAWFNLASTHTWLGSLLDAYKRLHVSHPWPALAAAVVVTVVLFVLLAYVWTRTAPKVARLLQRVYAWIDRNRL